MTVPLAMIGVVWVLWLANIPVTIMVFLGLIILVGIVVNNAIVLIDYINTLRGRGLDKREAIIEAGRARLRPIIMTALTTVVGLVPMALGIGEGAEIRAPMAITVIVGLSTATITENLRAQSPQMKSLNEALDNRNLGRAFDLLKPNTVEVPLAKGPESAAKLWVKMPEGERDRTQNQMMADIRKQFAKFAGVKFSLAEAGMVDGDMDVRESPIALSVRGPDMATLAETAGKIEALVRATPGSADISSTYAPGQPELRARIEKAEKDDEEL